MRGVDRLARLARAIRSRVRLGAGVEPLSVSWGHDRGLPICRYYLEAFLTETRADIRGRVLEFAEDLYSTRFGGSRVERVDVLNKDPGNPRATLVADLTKANTIPAESFDCIIATHVLHSVFELDAFITELRRLLRPGGVLLLAVPHVSMCDPRWEEMWRFTPEGLRRVLSRAFSADEIAIRAYGNALTAAGQIRGLVAEEFRRRELDWHDDRFAVEVCARAVKAR